jgi:hypothetical protein
MDASKAQQALTDGDWHSLVIALATGDVVQVKDAALLTCATIGAAQVTVHDSADGGPPSITVHVHSDVEGAAACLTNKVEQVQQFRALKLASGAPIGEVWLNGTPLSAPDTAPTDQAAPIFAYLRAMQQQFGVLVIPDDPGALYA